MMKRIVLTATAAVLVLRSAVAAEPGVLPEYVPPLNGSVIVHANDKGDESGSSIAITMRDEVWDAVESVLPEARWPKLVKSVRQGSIREATMTFPIGGTGQNALCRVVDMAGRAVEVEQLLKEVKTTTPVLVSVGGKMPHDCYLQLPTQAQFIVLLGPPEKQTADDAGASPSDPAENDETSDAGDPDNAQVAGGALAEGLSQIYYFSLLQKAQSRAFTIKTEEEAAKYLHGIWRLDKRAHVGGAHYVRADRGDDVTVICTGKWLVHTDFNQKKPNIRDSVMRVGKIVINGDASLEVDSSRKFLPIGPDHMAVARYDYIAIVQRVTCESLLGASREKQAASHVYSQQKSRPAGSDSKPQRGDTISLFDGETLDGWVTLDDQPVTRGWDVVDGAIHVKVEKERSGYIKTTRTFENFDLEFEWRVAEGGNSGVKYLAKEADSDRGRGYFGCEYQLLDDKRHKNGRTPTKTAGSLYDLYAPDKEQKHLKPLGEFNHARIVVHNGRIEHWLNGRKILEATIGSKDWQMRFKKSKINSVKEFAVGPGVILLQEHLSEAWFRNIRITELNLTDEPDSGKSKK